MIDWSTPRQTKFWYLLKAVRGHENDTCVREFNACTHDIQRVGLKLCPEGVLGGSFWRTAGCAVGYSEG